jgi:hypothetical protein
LTEEATATGSAGDAVRGKLASFHASATALRFPSALDQSVG